MKKFLKAGVLLLIAAAAAAGICFGISGFKQKNPRYRFNTANVELSDLVNTISATGTVEPEELVNVGAHAALDGGEYHFLGGVFAVAIGCMRMIIGFVQVRGPLYAKIINIPTIIPTRVANAGIFERHISIASGKSSPNTT